MLMRNGLVYVALQHIDFTQSQLPKVATGEVVVIDPVTDSIVTRDRLTWEKSSLRTPVQPHSQPHSRQFGGRFRLSLMAVIEAINPDMNTVDTQFAVTEATMGGDITALCRLCRGPRVLRSCSDANFANSLMTFDPSSGQRLNTLLGPLNVLCRTWPSIVSNEVYLAVHRTRSSHQGCGFLTLSRTSKSPRPRSMSGSFPRRSSSLSSDTRLRYVLCQEVLTLWPPWRQEWINLAYCFCNTACLMLC